MNQNDQAFLVQKIRTQYTEKEHTRLDELKALDKFYPFTSSSLTRF